MLLFFPPNKRDSKVLDAFFREKNLPTVADWYTKKQYAIAKDAIMNELKDVVERGDDSEAVRHFHIYIDSRMGHGTHGLQIISAIRSKLEEQQLPDTELIQSIWQGLMASVDWSARPDQIEGLALREVSVSHPSSVSQNLH